MFKVNNKNSTTTPGVVVLSLFVNFEHISHLALVFLVLTLSRSMSVGEQNKDSSRSKGK